MTFKLQLPQLIPLFGQKLRRVRNSMKEENHTCRTMISAQSKYTIDNRTNACV